MTSTQPVKHSDQLIDWLIELGYTHCFFVAGGNIMHLLDSARSRVQCIPVVHEVAAGIAVEYFNQVSDEAKAFALVTAGPGLTNIMTAAAGAWLEHRELLIIGGQVKSSDLMGHGLRQRGIQEIDGVSLMRSITKSAVRLTTPMSETEFKETITHGSTGRPGPIFVEACLDVQGGALSELTGWKKLQLVDQDPAVSRDIQMAMEEWAKAERPVLLIGAGVSRACASRLREAIEGLELPVMTTWHGADRVSSSSPNYVGRPETWGQRSSNLIINQADVIFAVGARLGLQETGFNWEGFASNSKIVQVDIDKAELDKGHPRLTMGICCDADHFLSQLLNSEPPVRADWMNYALEVRGLLPLNEPWNETGDAFVSPYEFYLALSEVAGESDVWVPASSGGANSVAIQALNQTGTQKVVCDNGLASMGYGLSGAIGAAFAQPADRILLIEGDGGFSQNLQELATVGVNSLNIKMFLFCNDGYGSIRTTQRNYFDGAYLGCDISTGLGFPNWSRLASAYGLHYENLGPAELTESNLGRILSITGPVLIEIPVDPNQTYWPKITSQVQLDGSMISNPLSNMSPSLPPELIKRVSRFL